MDGRSFGYGEIVSLEDASCCSRPVRKEPGYSCSGVTLLHLSVIISLIGEAIVGVGEVYGEVDEYLLLDFASFQYWSLSLDWSLALTYNH